jgi:hypothetical protein
LKREERTGRLSSAGPIATIPETSPLIPTLSIKWSLSRRNSRSLSPESLESFVWNQWILSTGISGVFGLEYAAIDAARADPFLVFEHNQRTDRCAVCDERKHNCGDIVLNTSENRSALTSDIV